MMRSLSTFRCLRNQQKLAAITIKVESQKKQFFYRLGWWQRKEVKMSQWTLAEIREFLKSMDTEWQTLL